MPGYSHLLDDERDQIAALKAAGRSIGAIAKAVGRAKSTVSRELRRNALPSGRYSPLHAAGAYQRRRRREAILERDRRLRDFVGDRLAEGWTPEQIAGWRDYPDFRVWAGMMGGKEPNHAETQRASYSRCHPGPAFGWGRPQDGL
jgi:IS30 family transposase